MSDHREKTNAMRLLEAAGINFTVLEYEFDEENFTGVHTAALLGIPAEQAFKTLTARGDKNGIQVFVIPVAEELNLKKAALISGNKHLELLHVKELPTLIGYPRGACTPIGMKKPYPVFFDETVQLFDSIILSAGARGRMLQVNPDALLSFLHAGMADLTQ